MENTTTDDNSKPNEPAVDSESKEIIEASIHTAESSDPQVTNNLSVSNEEDISPEELENLFEKNTDSFRCLAQILISRSSVLSHPLYKFDPPTDPGIQEAFNYKHELDLSSDTVGIETYKYKCKEFEIVPITRVVKSMTTDTLDLKYYGLNLKQIKAMCAAFIFNRNVQNLILEENVLESEAIYYISEMLRDNNTISYLSLKNCWISSSAIKNLSEGIFTSQVLRELDLSYNNIKSWGLASLDRSIRSNMSIKKLNLSHNQIQGDVGRKLGRALAENDFLEDLDLSWNDLNAFDGLIYICEGLREKDKLKVLNLAWNGISTKEALAPVVKYMRVSTALEHIDLSNNQMQGNLIRMVRSGILGNSSLISVNMSSNIITAEEASSLAHVFTADRGDIQDPLKLKYLDLENVYVQKSFIPYWRKLNKEGKFVKIEGIYSNYKIVGPDVKKLLFDRIHYLNQKAKTKKSRKEFGHFLYNINIKTEKTGKGQSALPLDPDGMVKADFLTALKKFKMPKIYKDEDLLKELMKKYTTNKDKINAALMKEEYYQYFPQTTIPEEKKKKKGGGKGKSKKKIKLDIDKQNNNIPSESFINTPGEIINERGAESKHMVRTLDPKDVEQGNVSVMLSVADIMPKSDISTSILKKTVSKTR